MKDLQQGLQLSNKISNLIERGESAKEQNKIEEAIESFKEALSLLNFKSKDSRIIELNIKIGDIYRLAGSQEESIAYFKEAYNAAKLDDNKKARADALVMLGDVFLCKGDLETSETYLEAADSIVNEMDYIEGKLEMCIVWARIYYLKKEIYKAREICNKALQMCRNDYLLYKGKILNILAELYKDITSVEEHVALLNQAYDCFEKADYQRGLLGVLNNLAAAYSDKLNDYDKALLYFYKLKELSEKNVYVEFRAIAYINIGETYLKTLQYEKAFSSLMESLNEPKGAYIDNVVFYTYILLSQACLKLNDFKGAYKYFMKADEQLDENVFRETTLAYYNKQGALLYTTLGQFTKAKAHIKRALSAVEKDESMIKWSVGLLYEQMRLKEAENKTDVLDILQGIEYALSKHKNNDEILDAVYDTALELIVMDYKELAFSFSKKYELLKPQSELVKLKRKYLYIFDHKMDKEQYLKELLSLLETAPKIKIRSLHWKIYFSLADWYFGSNDLEKAKYFYIEAYNVIKGMIDSVPEEYRNGFVKYNHLQKPFNKCNDTLGDYYATYSIASIESKTKYGTYL
jgi:tetratricopeptide (TPR) repeat protein